jgi:ElaB/YqjD/DUF883 family membrane-anchored ribosome-binding protein
MTVRSSRWCETVECDSGTHPTRGSALSKLGAHGVRLFLARQLHPVSNKENLSTASEYRRGIMPDKRDIAHPQERMQDVKEKAKNLAAGAGELAEQARDKVKEWASAASERAQDARSAIGTGVESLGEKIRQKGPEQGMMGSATAAVAGQLESAGAYIREHDLSEMGADLTREIRGLIRNYPLQSMLVGLGLGFLCARALRR